MSGSGRPGLEKRLTQIVREMEKSEQLQLLHYYYTYLTMT